MPSDIESRNLLVQYLQENNIDGIIKESYLFKYNVLNLDALRNVSS
ncbi:MAG: hypothetical protein J7K26_02330 [Candidatus Aenigmarchaeota archaeon]|nr:hypothetical protein [Candidatus Aenigmarchaeota archaeon]